MKALFLLAFIFTFQYAVRSQGDQTISTFADLQTLTLGNGIKIHFPQSNTTIYNVACKDLPKNDPFFISQNDYDEGRIKILQTRIAADDTPPLTILYTDGPSGDPSFIFASGNGQQIETLGGLELFIPGNGFIYTTGHTNTSFNKRSKYQFMDNIFTEVPQPFYYVGLKTVTTKAIVIYKDKNQKEVVANVPINTEVEVLLTEYSNNFGGTEYFLIKTPFGLVGWLSFSTYNLVEGTPLKGIFYAGD